MIQVSESYLNALKGYSFSPRSKIVVEGVEYLGNVIKTFPKIKHQATSIMGCFPTKTLDFEIYNYNNDINFLNKEIEVYLGFFIDGETKWVKQGVFIPKEKNVETNISTKIINFKGVEDKTQFLNSKYISNLNWDEKHTGLEIIQEICINLGLSLFSEDFPLANYEFKKPNFKENISYREVIAKLAEIGGAIAFFDNENKLKIKKPTETNYIVERKNFKEIKAETEKVINTIVLGKQNISDDIIYPETLAEERNEKKILDNPYVDLVRKEIIAEVSKYILNFKYQQVELNNFIDGYIFELNDVVKVKDRNGNLQNLTILDIERISRIHSNVKSLSKEQDKTNYSIAGSIKEDIKEVKFEVNHANQTITEVIKETENNKERINETLRTIDSTINTFKNMNGINLIKNSVMFSLNNENKPYSWNLSEEGTISVGTDSESIDFGGISKHGFELNGKKISQKINVIQDKVESTEKKPYSFSCLVKKTAIGVVKIRLYNEMEEHKLEITEELNYKNISIENILPKMNYLILEIEGSEAKFTDVNLIQSTYKGQWTQATDELLSTNVQFDINGMKIFSETNRGDYTTITPYEFSGYSNASGSLERVFGIDKDKTFSTKLEAKEEFTLKPAKIVPKRTGEVQGIAFVEVVK